MNIRQILCGLWGHWWQCYSSYHGFHWGFVCKRCGKVK